ncbi:S-methyl-5' [Dinothrombium tinctorium]|uniref:S-methyl-5'-thioadenosine phosphorylase n=1 Tax=Dinothrombium tinctorium TaxID=1965070 RepID=A0A443QW78_9ACAR|nr:S-methyl-5' [Dinothrombium tinctorium]
MNGDIKIGIIGGTGLESDLNILTDARVMYAVETPYGKTSDESYVEGKIGDIPVIVVGRHGKDHSISPSNVNYCANLWMLKSIGCTHVLATTACGSLKEHIKPGTFCVIDQYIDRTQGRRRNTLYSVSHVPQVKPFDEVLQQILEKSCEELNYEYHKKATTVTIEGPRFSTLAESRLYQSWNCDIVNMTTVPEAQIAAELGLVYAALALVTDYDCWHCDDDESVSVELVGKRLVDLRVRALKVLCRAVIKCGEYDWQSIMKRKQEIASTALMCE